MVRFSILVSLFILSLVYVVGGLFRLQIAQGDVYSERARERVALAGFLTSSRGGIYFTDKNNQKIPVALNRAEPAIIAAPAEIVNPEEVVQTFSDFLGLPADAFRAMLGKENDLYEVVKRDVSEEEIEAIRQVNFKGLFIEEEERRYYPSQTLGAHILGFVGPDDHGGVSGKYGLEAFFEESLKGIEGSFRRDQFVRPELGRDLYLTIDKNIQARAEEILGSLVMTHRAQGGTIIVSDPKTGKILALANAPTFNPNNYKDFSIARFLNPAVQAIYEPGSIFKVITMAAGIDSGAITPQTTYTDYGSVKVRDRVIGNWDGKAHGLSTMTEVLEKSLNTGVVFAEQKMGHNTFYDYIKRFGFGEVTGIDLPGELRGDLRPLSTDPKSDVQYATASFGQGVSVTPIQMIQSIAAIANKGVLMKPIIEQNKKPVVLRRVISEESARQVTDMMVSAVTNAKIASIPNYRVAGKTGTAQAPDFVRGGYTLDVINTYVGFAPASDARLIVLVKLDKPAGAPLAGATVVPAFRELMQFSLNYYNIPPDDLKR